jgi:putative zinc finger protein
VTESSSDFRDTLVELIETSPDSMDHPSPDRWIAYHRGQVSTEEEAELQEHLARCRECFDFAEAAAAFAQPDEEPDASEEMDTAAQWRLLRARLGSPSEPSPDNVRRIADSPRWLSRGPRLLSTLAALFCVATVGLTTWNLRLQSSLEALRAPRPDAVIVDFSAGERLPTPASVETTLSASTGMLVFHPAEEVPVYRLTLRDATSSRELWSYPLRPDRDSALTLQLPAGLRPGHYRLELADGSGGQAGRILQTYLVHVP